MHPCRYWLVLQSRAVNTFQQFQFVQSPSSGPVHMSQLSAQSQLVHSLAAAPVHARQLAAQLSHVSPFRKKPASQLAQNSPLAVTDPAETCA